MALQMDFSDASGTDHPSSYWRGVQVNIGLNNGIDDQTALITFYGYHDINAWRAKKQSLPGAVKNYSITPSQFTALYNQALSVFTVTNKSLTNNVATLQVANHNFQVGDTVVVTGVDSTFNGTWVVTATTTTTISFALTATNVTSTLVSGGFVTPSLGTALKQAIYALAQSVLDTPNPTTGVLQSFFTNATVAQEA